jgi:hypothetical protein
MRLATTTRVSCRKPFPAIVGAPFFGGKFFPSFGSRGRAAAILLAGVFFMPLLGSICSLERENKKCD